MEYKFSPATIIAASKAPAGAGSKGRTTSGWITTFGPPADSYGDIVHENAVDRHLAEKGNRLIGFSGHDPQQAIGWHLLWKRSHDGVYGIWTDFTFFEGIARAEEDLIRVREGAMAFSIGYFTRKEDFRGGHRILMDLDLMEASVVSVPANPRATIEQRTDRDSQDLARLARGIRDMRQRHESHVAEMRRLRGASPLEDLLRHIS
jgi:HK97 family phage prohead protease